MKSPMKPRVLASTLAVVALLVAAGCSSSDDDGGSGGSGSTSSASSPSGSDGSTSAAQQPPDPELAPFYSQTIDWEDCGAVQCGTLTVPIDYTDPGGETIDLNVKRTQATGDRVGSMVVNPGGPGAPGTTMVDNAAGYFRAPLLAAFDVVAFDPRGTGESDPVDCLSDTDLDAFVAADPTPDDKAEAAEAVQRQDDFFSGCVDNSDALIGHVTTVETARDMDVLRAALGEEKMTYFGFSYGTRLGATYAQLFPQQVGRLVLDGAIDPTLSVRQSSLSQAAGFQTALNAYVDDCVDGGDCFLGDTRQEGLDTITGLLDSIDQQPLPTSSDRDLQIGNAFYGLVFPLYSKDSWPYLDQGLQTALDGDGSTLLQLSDLYGSRNPDGTYSDNSLEAILAINCLDDPYALGAKQIPNQLPAFEKASPTFGDVFAWGLLGCHGIEVKASEPEPTITAKGAAPIVVIGTTRDPATPYEEAVALSKQLDSGVLITRDGDGHTGYNKGNSCVDDAVESYLIEGQVPDDGLTC